MPVNPSWSRWVLASGVRHFEAQRDALPFYLEGTRRDTSKEPDCIEFRMDGPMYTEVAREQWILKIEINILISSLINPANIYRLQTLIGLVCSMFTDFIVYEVNEGEEMVGCMHLLQKADHAKGDTLIVSNFGQVDPATPLQQATVEGHYVMELNT